MKRYFVFAESFGTKGRHGEGMYWTSTDETQEQETFLTKKAAQDLMNSGVEIVEAKVFEAHCDHCLSHIRNIVELTITPSGGLDGWTYLPIAPSLKQCKTTIEAFLGTEDTEWSWAKVLASS